MIDYIDLSGEWELSVAPGNLPHLTSFHDTITLPGTLSCSGKGPLNNERETGFLTDAHKFEGTAYFRKKIELRGTAGKKVLLYLERTRISEVFIDGKYTGKCESLAAPHIHDLTRHAGDGEHELIIVVSNVGYKTAGGHMTSKDTQTNWLGITGKIRIELSHPGRIIKARIFSDPYNKRIRVIGETGSRSGRFTCEVESVNTPVYQSFRPMNFRSSDGKFDITYELGRDAYLWSDETPYLYKLTLYGFNDVYTSTFGLRDFRAGKDRFYLNGRAVFLRGKHDGLLFPKTGYAPTDVETWMKVMGTAKKYGINHYRFHTCCPPEAAFEAADRLGIIMEPQLPFWGTIREEGEEGYNREEQEYLESEGYRMCDAFGDHPSFCMMSLGNELWGSQKELNRLLRGYKEYDSRRLYTQGSNNFQWFPTVLEEDDFFVGVRLAGDRLLRGSYAMCDAPLGHIQTDKPSTMHDYDSAVNPETKSGHGENKGGTVQIQYGTGVKTVEATEADSSFIPNVPIVTHEIGQYETFPNFDEIAKYTGPLKARNLEVFKERLEAAGLYSLWKDFFLCSGKLAVQCYKEELESVFRSKTLAGFQLLDLQDFMGQGTALVGILDAFMDSKGLIAPKDWRCFCYDAVLLARFPKYCCESGERFEAKLEFACFRSSFSKDWEVTWLMRGEGFRAEGKNPLEGSGDHFDAGFISADLPETDIPKDVKLDISIVGTDIKNSYELKVFPKTDSRDIPRDRIFSSLDEKAEELLAQGRTVMLVPEIKDRDGYIDGTYCTDFWCYPMFRSISESMGKPVPVGTMGLLIDNSHPALAGFASKKWTTPQWYDIVTNSRSEILDGHSEGKQVIVRTIDNFERNHDLALMYEYRKGNGKVVVLNCDIGELDKTTEGRAFLASVTAYLSADS
ncbi:MAG: beta-glucuronidase [Ruminococcus sp.]|nr:beta-glucuronidase [Ruminococcus sp.]